MPKLSIAKFSLLLLLKSCFLHRTTTAFSLQQLLPIRPDISKVVDIHDQYQNYKEGKYLEERVFVDLLIQEIKPVSPRLVFLRAADANHHGDDNSILEVLLKERDGFLSATEIEQITAAIAHDGSILHCTGFPERLSAFDGPSFFPHLKPLPLQPVCLHVVAANVTLQTGKLLPICPQERTKPIQAMRGRMPPLERPKPEKKKTGARGGGGNRDRGGIFASWVIETFGLEPGKDNLLDIAGGSGQLAFQFGVRRGFNVTVVDPRPIRLAADQQRALEYHRTTGLRVLPGERDPSLPAHDYGHHFCEVFSGEPNGRTFLVGAEAHVQQLQMYFDPPFASNPKWNDCAIVLGMHPDEATEDLVDLALAHNKPFAVVPCCVFWKRAPHRKTPRGEQVRTWEQFCDYLAAKDHRIQQEILPFLGRSRVLYFMGEK